MFEPRLYLDVRVWRFFRRWTGRAKGKKIFRLSFLLPLDFSRTFTNETHAIESFYQAVECLVTNICCFCFLGEEFYELIRNSNHCDGKVIDGQLIEKQFNCVSFLALSRDFFVARSQSIKSCI